MAVALLTMHKLKEVGIKWLEYEEKEIAIAGAQERVFAPWSCGVVAVEVKFI